MPAAGVDQVGVGQAGAMATAGSFGTDMILEICF